MKQEGKNDLFLRVYVSGGGCSGLSYGMGFEEKSEEDDRIIEQNGVKVLIDDYSQRYLKGANIDYIESLMGAGFKINNPNVTKSAAPVDIHLVPNSQDKALIVIFALRPYSSDICGFNDPLDR